MATATKKPAAAKAAPAKKASGAALAAAKLKSATAAAPVSEPVAEPTAAERLGVLAIVGIPTDGTGLLLHVSNAEAQALCFDDDQEPVDFTTQEGRFLMHGIIGDTLLYTKELERNQSELLEEIKKDRATIELLKSGAPLPVTLSERLEQLSEAGEKVLPFLPVVGQLATDFFPGFAKLLAKNELVAGFFGVKYQEPADEPAAPEPAAAPAPAAAPIETAAPVPVAGQEGTLFGPPAEPQPAYMAIAPETVEAPAPAPVAEITSFDPPAPVIVDAPPAASTDAPAESTPFAPVVPELGPPIATPPVVVAAEAPADDTTLPASTTEENPFTPQVVTLGAPEVIASAPVEEPAVVTADAAPVAAAPVRGADDDLPGIGDEESTAPPIVSASQAAVNAQGDGEARAAALLAAATPTEGETSPGTTPAPSAYPTVTPDMLNPAE